MNEERTPERVSVGIPQLRPGRVSVIAGLVVMLCFFLPMVQSCSQEFSPVSFTKDYLRIAAEELSDGPLTRHDDTVEMFPLVLSINMPHIFALAIVLAGFLVVRRPNGRKWLFSVLGLLTAVSPCIFLMEADGWLQGLGIVVVLAEFFGLLLMVGTKVHPLSVQALAQVVGVAHGLIWFGIWIVGSMVQGGDDDVLYGMYVGFFAALALLTGAILDIRRTARELGGFFPIRPADFFYEKRPDRMEPPH